jgi:hypothetical protein
MRLTARFRWAALGLTLVIFIWCLTPVAAGAQSPSDRVFEQILDQYVRDGFVYYAALQAERRAFDRHVESLAVRPARFDAWSEGRLLAYWLNGYNALVLRTVIDHYLILGTSAEFPEDSVMQIQGMFAGREHDIAGCRLTLQEIEDERVAAFGDQRAHLALGRGAAGSPRLRSVAFSGDPLEAQLQAVVSDFATTPHHVSLDRGGATRWWSARYSAGARSSSPPWLAPIAPDVVRSNVPSWPSSHQPCFRASERFSRGTRSVCAIATLTGVSTT